MLESITGMTIVGGTRLKCTMELAACAILEETVGDFIETGVFMGGTAALMKYFLDACINDQPIALKRNLYLADSFEGLPKPETSADMNDPMVQQGLFHAPYLAFLENFIYLRLLDTSVYILKGWFSVTLPSLKDKTFSFLRLDGDMYISTMDALVNLYPILNIGGYIYIDDYGSFVSCKTAVDEYRGLHNITEPFFFVPEGENPAEAIWWQKTRHINITVVTT
jgi:hypothetical protein